MFLTLEPDEVECLAAFLLWKALSITSWSGCCGEDTVWVAVYICSCTWSIWIYLKYGPAVICAYQSVLEAWDSSVMTEWSLFLCCGCSECFIDEYGRLFLHSPISYWPAVTSVIVSWLRLIVLRYSWHGQWRTDVAFFICISGLYLVMRSIAITV